ncbi:MAG TPA: tetratricopeptide repeat protein [Verrucomicrobiae bacterium]|jgi:tetratricopeptide (TPR) repeat protein
MQAQDATTLYLLKLWSWFEENKKAVIAGAAIVIVISFFFWFSSVQRDQKETSAGQAFANLMVSPAGESPAAYEKIASDYSGSLGAQRAALQAAVMLFDQGNYPDAQTQFQQFLDANPDSQFFTQAVLGSAACQAALGKFDQAIADYKRVLSTAPSGAPEINAANFAIAGIAESQGRFNDALTYYENVAAADVTGTLGAEARQRIAVLRTTQPSAAPVATPTGH